MSVLAACSPIADRAESNAGTQTAPIDLNGVVLTSREADCAAYTGRYETSSTDVSTGTSFNGNLEITADGAECTFSVNQIPNHDAGQGANWPNTMAPVEQVLTVTRTPEIAPASTPLGLGASAILLNGIKWEAYPAACFGTGSGGLGREKIGCGPQMLDHPWRYNVGSPLNDSFSFDNYYAHVQATGLYHYHSTPRVLYTATREFADDADCASGGASPVIGFANDGFPLFGPCFSDANGTVRSARSSYSLKSGKRQPVGDYVTPYQVGEIKGDDYDGQFVGDFEFVDGSGDLDACNGMTVNGQYGYYVTEQYPYALKCLSGTPSSQFP